VDARVVMRSPQKDYRDHSMSEKHLDIRSQQRFNNFQKALKLYEEAVAPKMSRLEEEGLIQRFEYTFELAWKCLQDLLQERGYANVRGPRPVLEQAFQDGIITHGTGWLEMLRARNETTHLYDETIFQSVSAQVKGPFLELLQEFKRNFKK
jgi:nucleotidyltransferase substrate binding protein (TIGR01987 family)